MPQNYIILDGDGNPSSIPFSNVVVDSCGIDLCVSAKPGESLTTILKRICAENSSGNGGKTYLTDGNGTSVLGSGTLNDPYTVNIASSGPFGTIGLEMPNGFTVTGSPAISGGAFHVSTPLEGIVKAGSGAFGTVDIILPLLYFNGQLLHNNSGVIAGTYNNVTVDPKGHVTAGVNVPYLQTETDPIWNTQKGNYYTKTELQTSGLSQVNWDNITNKPSLGGFIFNQFSSAQSNSNFWINSATSGSTIARFGSQLTSSVNITNGSINIQNLSPLLTLKRMNSGGAAIVSFIPEYNTDPDSTHPVWSIGAQPNDTKFSISRAIGGSPTSDLIVQNDGTLIISSLKTVNAAPSTTGILKFVTVDSTGKLSYSDSTLIITPTIEVSFKVDGAGSQVASGASSFTLLDCGGIAMTNKKIKLFRERERQFKDDDFTYDGGTGIITVTVPFKTGERIVIEAHPSSLWVECNAVGTGINVDFPYDFSFDF